MLYFFVKGKKKAVHNSPLTDTNHNIYGKEGKREATLGEEREKKKFSDT